MKSPVGKSNPANITSYRLNKYLAHSGVASRRKADEIIKAGKVKVDGKVVLEPGFELKGKEKITMGGKEIKLTIMKFYILLNKPKNHITTVSDERGRKTVMDLVLPAFQKLRTEHRGVRLYPVGRLDKDTTGVLLLTNDGDLAQRLTHPKYEIQKVYRVELDKALNEKDEKALNDGVELEDGEMKIDELAFPEKGSRQIVGIELHSGKNRIVRRLFEHLGYEVRKLDRVVFAGLTKEGLPRGKWKLLKGKDLIKIKRS